jgi:NAD(P)H-hydrate repair Nnr-like enzyme with NAD(P)H-hydrate dehydratase domain
MIGSLLAQGQPAGTAAIAAVLLHALAGTHVKDKQGSPVTVMAGDLLEAIPEVLGM